MSIQAAPEVMRLALSACGFDFGEQFAADEIDFFVHGGQARVHLVFHADEIRG